MIEFEKKIVIYPKEYIKLFNSIDGKTFVQTNYYYDTEDFAFNKKGVTCRIREKGNEYKATIKSHSRDKKEKSVENSQKVQNQYDKSFFHKMGVVLQGKLETTRKELILPCGIKLALDRNKYFDIEDYELELEYAPEQERLCEDILVEIVKSFFDEEYMKERVYDDLYYRQVRCIPKSERFFNIKKRRLK